MADSAASFVTDAVGAIGSGFARGVASAKAKGKALAGVGQKRRADDSGELPFRGQAGTSSCLARETQAIGQEVLNDGRERSPKRERKFEYYRR